MIVSSTPFQNTSQSLADVVDGGKKPYHRRLDFLLSSKESFFRKLSFNSDLAISENQGLDSRAGPFAVCT